METVAVLPDDVLAGVLGRLPPRGLAAARCVCRSWRALVDGRRLLLPGLLPHAVAGLFVSFLDHETPHFFARPSPPERGGGPARIDGGFSFVDARRRPRPYHWHDVVDHCNGLVLFSGGDMSLYLCNPVTRWWARLPRGRSARNRHWGRRALVVYDPAVSPHWEVLMAPLDPDKKEKKKKRGEIVEEEEYGHGQISEDDGAWRMMDWPPATCLKEEEEEEDGHGEILENDAAWQMMEWPATETLEEEEEEEEEEEVGHGEILEDDGAWGTMEWPPATSFEEEEEEEEEELMELEELEGDGDDDGAWRMMEWPPATWTWHVISSRTMRWEEKVFVREGEAAGTVAGLLLHSSDDCFEPLWHSVAYCRGEVYIHCRGEYVSRLSMSTNKYQVIKSPIDLAEHEDEIGLQSIIGRSKNRIHFAATDRRMGRLRVWILNESCGEMEWELKHQSVVNIPIFLKHRDYDGPFWIMDDFYRTKEGKKVLKEEWNSDDDNVVDIVDDGGDEDDWKGEVSFLGFHPYKDVIFIYSREAVACHLNSTKIQYLGRLYPRTYNRGFYESFVYTPCLMEV